MYDGALYAVPNHSESRAMWSGLPRMNGDVVVAPPPQGDHLADQAGGELDRGDGDERPTVRHAGRR